MTETQGESSNQPTFIHGRDMDNFVAEQERWMKEVEVLQKAAQQDAYNKRLAHAKDQGEVWDYKETVLFGVPYAWVRYKDEPVKLLHLTEDGVARL